MGGRGRSAAEDPVRWPESARLSEARAVARPRPKSLASEQEKNYRRVGRSTAARTAKSRYTQGRAFLFPKLLPDSKNAGSGAVIRLPSVGRHSRQSSSPRKTRSNLVSCPKAEGQANTHFDGMEQRKRRKKILVYPSFPFVQIAFCILPSEFFCSLCLLLYMLLGSREE